MTSQPIELSDAERQAAELAVWGFHSTTAEVVERVVAAINEKRRGAPVGTIVVDPETGRAAQRIEAGGTRYWSGMTPMSGPWAPVAALVADETAESWKVVYTPGGDA